ncbi:MAG: IS66 family transposase [bacterium]
MDFCNDEDVLPRNVECLHAPADTLAHGFLIAVHIGCVDKPGNDQIKKAKKYALNQEECFRRFLEDGRIPISNNPAENAIRPFVIGRKNFLFCVSEAGAQATANAYSLAETAKANGLDVLRYFEYILHRMRMRDDGVPAICKRGQI